MFKKFLIFDNFLFITLFFLLSFSIWLIFMSYTCNVSKGYYSLIKKLYLEKHVKIIFFFPIYAPITVILCY